MREPSVSKSSPPLSCDKFVFDDHENNSASRDERACKKVSSSVFLLLHGWVWRTTQKRGGGGSCECLLFQVSRSLSPLSSNQLFLNCYPSNDDHHKGETARGESPQGTTSTRGERGGSSSVLWTAAAPRSIVLRSTNTKHEDI